MFRVLAILVAVLVMAAFGATATSAPIKTDPPVQPRAMDQKPAPMDQQMGQKVEGTVKTVRGNTVTLEDGTQLSIPGSVKVPMSQLKPGAQISAEYEERGGQKIATALLIKG
jgi:Rieske Fe-S protein